MSNPVFLVWSLSDNEGRHDAQTVLADAADLAAHEWAVLHDQGTATYPIAHGEEKRVAVMGPVPMTTQREFKVSGEFVPEYWVEAIAAAEVGP